MLVILDGLHMVFGGFRDMVDQGCTTSYRQRSETR